MPNSQPSSNMNTTSATTESAYLEPMQYISASGTCSIEFTNILNSTHYSTDPEDILVTVNEEAMTKLLIDQFKHVGASIECETKAVPFLCQHLFGLCDELGISIQPTIQPTIISVKRLETQCVLGSGN